MAMKILKEQVELQEKSITEGLQQISTRIDGIETSSLCEVTDNETGGKKRIDKFDYIMSTLNNIQRRLTSIEQSATNINSGISIDILSKIEEKGNEVAEANQVSTNSIAKAIKILKTLFFKNLLTKTESCERR